MEGFISYLAHYLKKKRQIVSETLKNISERKEMIDKLSKSFNLSPEQVISAFDDFDNDSKLEFSVEFNNQRILAKDLISQLKDKDFVYISDMLEGYAILHSLEKDRQLDVKPFFSYDEDKLRLDLTICRFKRHLILEEPQSCKNLRVH